MFVLVWVYFIILNIICVYRALQTVTDNRLPAWEVASSAVQTQHSILQYSTARGTRPCFVAFSTCFPLSCEPFLGHFSAPVIVGLRGDNIWLQMPAPRIRIYLPACIENCAQSLLGTKDLSAGHKGSQLSHGSFQAAFLSERSGVCKDNFRSLHHQRVNSNFELPKCQCSSIQKYSNWLYQHMLFITYKTYNIFGVCINLIQLLVPLWGNITSREKGVNASVPMDTVYRAD